ncbi:hypothetical protein JW859_02585 [bacterium]|nr:hypothetical protein [bacterium]
MRTGMVCLLTVLVAMANYASAVAAESAEPQECPRHMPPQRLAERLAEPERTMRLQTAEMMHEQQLELLEGTLGNNADWQSDFLTGVAFALEEYWTLELSYPENFEQLQASGYLAAGWAANGYQVCDFDGSVVDPALKQLVYVPLPLPLTQLKGIPGVKGCTEIRRCFYAYSLLIPGEAANLWAIESGLETSWIEQYVERGCVEIMHVNKESPGTSGCSICH